MIDKTTALTVLPGLTRGPTRALRSAAYNVLRETKRALRHNAAMLKARRYAGKTGLKLHVGCGPNIKPGWINIDLFSYVADLQLDVRERFPFDDGAVIVSYSEHFFEHLNRHDGEALNFLREQRRLLSPDGVLSMGVPDGALAAVAYATNDPEYYARVSQEIAPNWVQTRMDRLNYDYRQGDEHRYAYDFETLAKLLNEAGFSRVNTRPFDPDLDTKRREWGTLYIDARR
jgi:predicted SAM-dependent methyltransferase